MAGDFTSSPISSYKVIYYGNDGRSNVGAFIHCYHNNQNVMTCTFYNDINNVPPNSQGARVDLRYPITKFDSVLDILRNEGPLFFGYINSNKTGYIASNSEPVGEGEA